MGVGYLVLDMQRLMDESHVGKAAGAMLNARFAELAAQHKELTRKAALAAPKERAAVAQSAHDFEEGALKGLQKEQHALRLAMLERARPLVEAAMKAAKVTLVLDRASVLMCDPKADITLALMAQVDAQGPLAP